MINKILQFVFQWEGGYVNHPNDPGGATNLGITQRTFDAWREKKGLPKLDVKAIKKPEAIEIYKEEYWNPEWEKLGFRMAAVITDTAVNMGKGVATRFIKESEGDPVKYLQLRTARYKLLIANNPKLKVFEKGWMNRVADLRRFIDVEWTNSVPTSGGSVG